MAPLSEVRPRSDMTVTRLSNLVRRSITRSPKASRREADAASASGSWSRPTTATIGLASRITRACPPPPTVASTTTPGGTASKSRAMRSAMTGWWRKRSLTVPRCSATGISCRLPAAPRPAVAAGISPRLARRKRAELGLSIFAGRETAGERQVAAPCVVRNRSSGTPFGRGFGRTGSVRWVQRGVHLRNGRPLPSGRRPRARRW